MLGFFYELDLSEINFQLRLIIVYCFPALENPK